MALPISKIIPRDLTPEELQQALYGRESLWHEYGRHLVAFAVNLAIGLVILAVTLWAAGWMSKLVRNAIARAHRRRGQTDATLETFVASLTRYIVTIIGAVAVLQQLGVKTTSVLAVLGAASIAIGLALQGTLGNLAAGVMLLLFRPYRVGDLIETGARMGTVVALDLFVTELTTPDNLKLVVPNGKVFGETIVNFTTHPRRRVDVVFHVPPQRDLAAILADLQARVGADARVLSDPPPLFEAMTLNELYAEGAVRVWAAAADYGAVKTDLVLAVQRLAAAQAALPAASPPGPSVQA